MSSSRTDQADAGRPVFELFEEWARRDADRTAVFDGSRHISYGELNASANRLAHWLRGRGVGPECVVGVHFERCLELVIGALAILKAGAGYLPMDPANPPGRIGQMLTDAGATLVLCGAGQLTRLQAGTAEPVPIDTLDLTGHPAGNLGLAVRPDDLAYVVYTSGSTGRPKGVLVTHAALGHLVRRVGSAYQLGPDDRAGLACSPSFDVSVSEVWLPLAAGAGIDIAQTETLLSPEATIRWLDERRVTITVLPTPLAERALRAHWPAGIALRTLLTGGDRLHVWPDPTLSFQLINNYGPAENTVISSFGVVPSSGQAGLPSIGTPVDGTTVEILDAELRACPAGEVGEIYLGGPQLARGYLGRPDLTADRFVPHPRPSRPGERLYRTGDLGRRLPAGAIDFVGRVDDQVKVRGQRVELGEVTAVLAGHPEVSAAHLVMHADGASSRLVAYVAPTDVRRLPAASQLRRYLAERLPAAMVPVAFVVLEALPLNTNGKVDRQALPAPDLRRTADTGRYVAPRTATERGIAQIWGEVLHLDRVGIEDSFVDLGGHSLLATQIVARTGEMFGVDVPIREVFARPVLAELAEAVDTLRTAATGTGLPPVVPGSGGLVSPLSLAQQQVWFIDELSPGNAAYQAQATIRVVGPLDLDVLARALTEITRRHESLRTTYEERDGQPCQVVHPPAAYPLARADLSGVAVPEREARLEELVREQMRRPFDVGVLPLTRWTAVRLAPQEHELIMVEHHLVHDGWSFAVFMQELEALYNAFVTGEESGLPEPTIQFRDYVQWQRDLLGSATMQRQLSYWKERLAGAGVLSLSTDRPRPKVPGFRGHVLRLEMPAGLPGAIRDLCRREGASPFMTMYAAFVALLHRYTADTDICVASGFANRRRRETEALVGMLVNPVVLRLCLDGTTTFRTLLARARDAVLEAAANQECPFPLVVQALGHDRDVSRNPLAQVMFSAHDSAVRNPELAGATSTIFERSNDTAKVDLNVIVVPRAKSELGRREHTDDRVTVLWEYDRDLFDADTMRTMSEAYLRLLAAAVAEPDAAVSRLPLLDGRQVRSILVDWNPGLASPPLPPAESIPQLVARHVRAAPDALAIAEGARLVTYGELYHRAACLAARLTDLGLGPEGIVGVCLPRCADLVIVELGVLLARAAFLPVDPAHPTERIRDLLVSSGARVLVTTSDLRDRVAAPLPSLLVSDIDEMAAGPGAGPDAPAPGYHPGDLAYVIYTSGSTGRPKGVMVQQDTFTTFVAWHRERFALTAADRTTVVGSPSFDLQIWEFWPTLTVGASMHLPPDEILLSAPDLQQWLVDQRITTALFPAPLARPLLEREWPDPGALRLFHSGGDRMTIRPRPGLGFAVFNAYGPTETTVIITTGPVAPDEPGAGLPHIGWPSPGSTAYILDPELNPVPRGVIGEIYLGGALVARGYLDRPDLTADRFVPDPFSARPGARLYRTGDMARHLRDGAIDYIGRGDDQVQIRGHRIEPAEVTATLRTLAPVRDAYTTAYTDPATGRTQLVAYVTAAPGAAAPGPAEMREHLSRRLPPVMVPAVYVVLDELPRTTSSKIDRSALPAPDLSAPSAGAEAAPPSGEYERRLAAIWSAVLGVPRIGVHDGFFDLGGHSLLLAEVRRRIADELGRRIPLMALFEHPTVGSLAAYLEHGPDHGPEHGPDHGLDQDGDGPAAAAEQELGERRRSGQDRLRRQRAARAAGIET